MSGNPLEAIDKLIAKSMTIRDKTGAIIPFSKYSALKNDREYCTVGRDEIGNAVVSTAWVGITGILFETMVFRGRNSYTVGRWDSEEEAKAEHLKAVAELRSRL